VSEVFEVSECTKGYTHSVTIEARWDVTERSGEYTHYELVVLGMRLHELLDPGYRARAVATEIKSCFNSDCFDFDFEVLSIEEEEPGGTA
jgi:hypothetical protein